jgi:hypothetical protein
MNEVEIRAVLRSAEGKFNKPVELNEPKGVNPNGSGKGADISKVTYGDNVGTALPRGTKG